MAHGSSARTTMTSLRKARQTLKSSSHVRDIKLATKRAYRRRMKQVLATTEDFDDVDFGMECSEFDTAWAAY